MNGNKLKAGDYVVFLENKLDGWDASDYVTVLDKVYKIEENDGELYFIDDDGDVDFDSLNRLMWKVTSSSNEVVGYDWVFLNGQDVVLPVTTKVQVMRYHQSLQQAEKEDPIDFGLVDVRDYVAIRRVKYKEETKKGIDASINNLDFKVVTVNGEIVEVSWKKEQ